MYSVRGIMPTPTVLLLSISVGAILALSTTAFPLQARSSIATSPTDYYSHTPNGSGFTNHHDRPSLLGKEDGSPADSGYSPTSSHKKNRLGPTGVLTVLGALGAAVIAGRAIVVETWRRIRWIPVIWNLVPRD